MSSIPKKIKIMRKPDGEPPEWVRVSWVGCELPCSQNTCPHVPVEVKGVVTDTPESATGYIVEQKAALEILDRKAPGAALWFKRHGYPKDGEGFHFNLRCAEVIEWVPDSEITRVIQCDDMETGRPRIPHAS